MRLADIMETAVDTIGLDDSAEAAWERMRLGRIHHLVVMNEHAMAGSSLTAISVVRAVRVCATAAKSAT